MSLLKNRLYLVVLAAVILIIAVVAGYKAFSLYSFNSFAKELNSENKNLYASFEQEVSANNVIETNIARAMDIETNFDKETNTKYLNVAEAEYAQALTDYKKGIDTLDSKSSDVASFKDMPLWLDANQKKFASDIASALDQYLNARKADYKFQEKTKPINNNMFQIIEDSFVIIDYSTTLEKNIATALTPAQLLSALSKDFSDLKAIEKYTKASHKFEGQDKLASEFPNSYKAFGVIKETYSAVYLFYKSLASGDYSQLDQAAAVLTQVGGMDSAIAGLSLELQEKNKPYVVKIKDSYVTYAKTLDFFAEKKLYSNLLSREKTLTKNNQNKLTVFVYLVQLYYTDEQKYPTDTSFSSLTSTLKSGNHSAGSLKYNTSDFTYTSDGSNYYEMGYKDEVSGKQTKVVVGVKEDMYKTLGATIHIPTIKVEDKKVRLEFVGSLTGSFESLIYPKLP
jgi:hypothetical protein